MKVALLQLPWLGPNPSANLNQIIEAIKEAKSKNADLRLAITPESCLGTFAIKYLAQIAEEIPSGPASQAFSKLSKSLSIYIMATFIERDGSVLYNTCLVWNPQGELIAKHRKLHLFVMNFDDEIGGSVHFTESSVVTPGKEFTTVLIDNRKFGIGICHDMKFDEMARIYRNEGCEAIVYPSAVVVPQAEKHWELLLRSRANDCQLYVIATSPTKDVNCEFVCYGHSMVVDPWARVVAEAKEEKEVLIVNLDFSLVENIRKNIPLFEQRRTDLY